MELTPEQIKAQEVAAKAAEKEAAAARKAAEKQAAADAKAAEKVAKQAEKDAAKQAADAAKAQKAADAQRAADEKSALKAAKDGEKAAAAQAKLDAKEAAAKAKQAEKDAKAAEKAANQMPESNGVRRPKPTTLCGQAWAVFDEISAANGTPVSISDAMPVAKNRNLNEGNVRAEYARWKTFFGLSGRIPPLTKTTAPAAE